MRVNIDRYPWNFPWDLCYEILAKMSSKYYSFYSLNPLIYFSHKWHKRPNYRVFSFLLLDASGFCSSLEVILLWQVGFSRKSEGDCAGCKHEHWQTIFSMGSWIKRINKNEKCYGIFPVSWKVVSSGPKALSQSLRKKYISVSPF